MREKIIESVKEIGSLHGFQCYVVASSDGRSIWRGGDSEGLIWGDMVNVLFGGTDEVIRLFDYLEGKILPQTYQQGEVVCLLLKPAEDIVVGFFAQDGRDAVSLYREGKDLSKALEQMIRE